MKYPHDGMRVQLRSDCDLLRRAKPGSKVGVIISVILYGKYRGLLRLKRDHIKCIEAWSPNFWEPEDGSNTK